MAGIRRQNVIVTADDCKIPGASNDAHKDLVLFLVGDSSDWEVLQKFQDKLAAMLPDLRVWITIANGVLPDWKHMRVDNLGRLYAFEKDPIRWFWLGENYGHWFVEYGNRSEFVSNTNHGLQSIFKGFFIERLLTKSGAMYRVNYSPFDKRFV
jgi:hypothetical protein